jgi:hypothetical protein
VDIRFYDEQLGMDAGGLGLWDVPVMPRVGEKFKLPIIDRYDDVVVVQRTVTQVTYDLAERCIWVGLAQRPDPPHVLELTWAPTVESPPFALPAFLGCTAVLRIGELVSFIWLDSEGLDAVHRQRAVDKSDYAASTRVHHVKVSAVIYGAAVNRSWEQSNLAQIVLVVAPAPRSRR